MAWLLGAAGLPAQDLPCSASRNWLASELQRADRLGRIFGSCESRSRLVRMAS